VRILGAARAAAVPTAVPTARPIAASDEPWAEEVSSYAIDDGERLLLFDPLAV
jgi:hypothetical protein